MASKDTEDQNAVDDGDTLVIPPSEELKDLPREDLDALHERAVEAFRTIYGDGTKLSPEDLETLRGLKVGIKALEGERKTRDDAEAETGEEAAKIAADLGIDVKVEDDPEGDDEDGEGDDESDDGDSDDAADDADKVVAEAEAIAASAEVRVNLAGRRRQPVPVPAETSRSMKDIAFAPDGKGIDKLGIAKLVDKQMGAVNLSAYASAAAAGKKMSERFPIATITREFPAEARVTDEDPTAAMNFAVDETNLPKGSLTASGGWCAPSETSYDLCDLSEAKNLISLPEMQINRGGIRFAPGPDYATIYGQTGFTYTEAQDIAGNYNGAGGGTKPCFKVPCPPFTEKRLGYSGVCITAGLLQQKGYPEVIENYINIALNAHAHRVSAAVINDLVSQSTAVSLAAAQKGAVAPLLTAIDLQAAHYRAVNRMSDTATLEIVLPTWTDVVIRADLARRLGVDLLDVPMSRVNAWMAARNVNAQYVVDWQDIATTPASGFIATPASVKFLIYAAGTFVKGVTSSITFENIYDTVGLGTNDYTALFTEDPYLVAKRCQDSRVVTVPICADGATHVGIDIACDGQ